MCNKQLGQRRLARFILPLLATFLCVAFLGPVHQAAGQSIIRKLQAPNERIELSANTSRILELDLKFTRVQVNNPSLVTPTVLSPNQVQIMARSPGVTQMNLWDEDGNIYTVDIIIYGDVQELQMALEQRFPNSSVRVYRYSRSLFLDGYVDSPSHVSIIQQLAEDYAPKVINNISVGGVQQILLHVKVMEVSRSKLRSMGFDFTNVNGNDVIASTVSGLIARPLSFGGGGIPATTGGELFSLGIIDGNNNFNAFLEALRQNNLMKILAEPTLTTISGRPASFNVGGEFPILIPQSLGTVSVQYRSFGTQIDFVPLVLDNGNIRLEVRPRVSEIDTTRSVEINDTTVPGLRVREVDTAVELKAGQTLAIAGLIQTRVEAQNKGIPILGELPWIGMAFRRVEETVDEIETIILVRPEFVAGMDPHEVPKGGPGTDTVSPNDIQLFIRGHIEVPRCCTDGSCSKCRHSAGRSAGAPLPPDFQMPVEATDLDLQTKRHPSRQFFTRAGSAGVLSATQRFPQQLGTQTRDSFGRSRENRVTSGILGLSNPRNPTNAQQPQNRDTATSDLSGAGLIGPVGYDVQP